jgi:hypothetical protein
MVGFETFAGRTLASAARPRESVTVGRHLDDRQPQRNPRGQFPQCDENWNPQLSLPSARTIEPGLSGRMVRPEFSARINWSTRPIEVRGGLSLFSTALFLMRPDSKHMALCHWSDCLNQIAIVFYEVQSVLGFKESSFCLFSENPLNHGRSNSERIHISLLSSNIGRSHKKHTARISSPSTAPDESLAGPGSWACGSVPIKFWPSLRY